MHDPLIDLATVPPVPLHPARAAAPGPRPAGSPADLLAVPDDALERAWRWRPSDTDEVEVRYGFYAIHEWLERGDRRDRGRVAPMAPAAPCRSDRPSRRSGR